MNPELRTPPDALVSRRTGPARNRILALIVSMAVMAMAAVGFAGTASAAPPATGASVPVPEQVTPAGTVEGVFDIQRIVVENGALQAVGTFDGTVTDAAGDVTDVTQAVTTPVALQEGETCEILNLVLGPLNLNLLGLEVFLDTVTLVITAVPGAGNLLGNLLCAVAGLLDSPTGGLSGIAALLNRILSILG
jgi:hypothetical protein